MTFAIVKVLPEPVTPRSVCTWLPSLKPCTKASMASGWSPVGAKSEWSLKFMGVGPFCCYWVGGVSLGWYNAVGYISNFHRKTSRLQKNYDYYSPFIRPPTFYYFTDYG